MKKFQKITLTTAILSTMAVSLTSCFGKFSLTRKVYQFHDGILGNDIFPGKFVKTLLMYFPGSIVYGFAGFVDGIILNLIEFWTGNNPLAMQEGQIEMQMVEKNGKNYQITATKNQFLIKDMTTGVETTLLFSTADLSWNVIQGDQSVKIMDFFQANGQNMVNIYQANGEKITLSEAELAQNNLALAK